MSMWLPLDKTAAFGEDPARPSEFIYHVPEYDEAGNLVSGDPDYYRNDPPPKGHSARQGEGFGLNTTIKGSDIERPGPAEVVSDYTNLDSPSAWGPELVGESKQYPYPGPEQLKKDTHWALGPNKSFTWPGGQEAAENAHNIVTRQGFNLENSGTDDKPIPSYRHEGTGARIEPSGNEDEPWQLSSPNWDTRNDVAFGTTTHSSAVGAALAHIEQLDDMAQHARERAMQQSTTPLPGRDWRGNPRTRRTPSSRAPRGPRGSRPTNVYDAMRHAVGTASYQTDPNLARWDLRNEGTTFGGHPANIPTVGTGQMEDWVAQQYRNDLDSGKVQHVIYHHRTPLAWLKVEPGASGDPNAGDATHTWVVPDKRYSQTSSKRQYAIRSAISGTNHGDAVEEPYDPARGFPSGHLSDNGYGYHSDRSQKAHDLTQQLANQGFNRPQHNSRQSAVFIKPSLQTEEQHPYYSRTRTHGVYMRPVDTQSGPQWVVGEHEDGTNKVQGSKRFRHLDEALGHADRMHQWVLGGSQGPSPALSVRSPRVRTSNTYYLDDEELPFYESSVADWSRFLRDE